MYDEHGDEEEEEQGFAADGRQAVLEEIHERVRIQDCLPEPGPCSGTP